MTELAPLPKGRPQRLVYFGTPALAVPPLQALVANGFDVVLAVTGVDKRRGRGKDVTPSPVKAAAVALSIPVSHQVTDALRAGADLGVVVAFGQLIKAAVLEELPMVNLHFSLLPRWRGAAPVERALLAGDQVTGVCLMQLEAGLDTGPIVDVDLVPIDAGQTAEQLRWRLVSVGTDQLVRNLVTGLGPTTPQVGEPVHASKLDPVEFEIGWAGPAVELDRLIRVGRAWTTFRGRRLKILRAEIEDETDGGEPAANAETAGTFIGPVTVGTRDGSLRLVLVQPEGKSAMDARSWSHGAKPRIGEHVGGQS